MTTIAFIVLASLAGTAVLHKFAFTMFSDEPEIIEQKRKTRLVNKDNNIDD